MCGSAVIFLEAEFILLTTADQLLSGAGLTYITLGKAGSPGPARCYFWPRMWLCLLAAVFLQL